MKTSSIFRFLAIFLFLALSFPRPTLAGVQDPFRVSLVRDNGLTRTTGVLEVTDQSTGSMAPQGKDLFFNALAPHNSGKGVVKSFSVRVAERKPRYGSTRPIPHDENLVAQKFPEFKPKVPFGSLNFPVSGEVSSFFGSRRSPFRGVKRRFHSGLDISAKSGTPIKVVSSGRVIYSGWRQGYGLMVEVDHGNGMSTVYAHCSRVLVRVGDTIGTGNLVGQVGRTGVTTGPHLHFEVRRRGSFVDPMPYLAH